MPNAKRPSMPTHAKTKRANISDAAFKKVDQELKKLRAELLEGQRTNEEIQFVASKAFEEGKKAVTENTSTRS